MRHRIVWFFGGWILGNLTAAWLRRRVRQGVRRYAPERWRREVSDRALVLTDNARRIVGEVFEVTQNDGDSAGRTSDRAGSPRSYRRPVRPVSKIGTTRW